MPRKPKVSLTPTQEREIVAMYADSAIKTTEIIAAYGINSHQIYRALKRQGFSPIRRPNRRPPSRSITSMTEPTNGTVPALPASTVSMAVTVDKEGLVVSARRDEASEARWPAWEITYQGAMRVRATSIEEAIQRAKGAPEVRRIVGAQQVQA